MKKPALIPTLVLSLLLCRTAAAEPIAVQVDEMLYGPQTTAAPWIGTGTDSGPRETRLRASVGVGVVSVPEFEGADKNETKFLPMVDISYDRFFLSWTKGLGMDAYSDDTWTVSPALRYRFGRDADDSPLLRGMGDIDDGAEIGGQISWHPYSVGLVLNAFHGLGDAKGYTIDIGAVHRRQLFDPLTLTVGASAMYADSKYNQQHFGVTGKQSAASGYRAYEPDGGFKHCAVHGALSWELTPVVTLDVFGQFKKLTGPAADSPLVKAGSNEQFMGGVSLNLSLGD